MPVKVKAKLLQLNPCELMDLSYYDFLTEFPIDRPATLFRTSTAMGLVDNSGALTLLTGDLSATKPQIQTIEVAENGQDIALTFSLAVSSGDMVTGFHVYVDGVVWPIIDAAHGVPDGEIILTVPGIKQGQTVLVSYAASVGTIAVPFVGIKPKSFIAFEATNNSTVLAPTLDSVDTDVDGTIIDLVFSENMSLLSTGDLWDGFSVKVNGVARAITAAEVNTDTVSLTVAEILPADVVTVSYDMSVFNLATAANSVPFTSFTDEAVTNNVVVPALSSAAIGDSNTSAVVLTFSRTVQASDYEAGFSISVNASPATFTAPGNSAGTTITLLLDTPAVATDVILVSYNSGPGTVQSPAGAQVASFTDSAVTNNITP